MRNRKKAYLFAAAALIILLGAGLGGYILSRPGTSIGPSQKVRFADGRSLTSAQLYVALEKGYFKGEGLEVTYLPFSSGKEALDAVIGGTADFATVSDFPLVSVMLKGTKIRIIATLTSTSAVTNIIGRKDRGISSAKDLKGKKIGVALGTNMEFILDTFLLFHRVPRDDVRLINVTPQGMADAFRKGEIDAAISWEPHLSELRDQLGTKGVVLSGEEQKIYKQTWDVVAMEDFVQKNPETVKRVLRAFMRSDAFIQERRQEARQMTARFLIVDTRALEPFWKSFAPNVSLGPLLIENLENQTRWMMRSKLTDRKDMPNYLDYIYFEGLESVKPEAVTIVHPKVSR
ncbi:MAG TPA: NrtA/SsuA/CpmA family ABC transporter substrate-binding protein [Syntrophorhabdaceae bacterium]